MAAMTLVLETYELLKNIIMHVSAYEIRKLRQVSKTWNTFIKASLKIRGARCLKPINWEQDSRGERLIHEYNRAERPIYEYNSLYSIRLHP